jgi:hypothetical protein
VGVGLVGRVVGFCPILGFTTEEQVLGFNPRRRDVFLDRSHSSWEKRGTASLFNSALSSVSCQLVTLKGCTVVS